MAFYKRQTIDSEKASILSKQCGISILLAELLITRGIDDPQKVRRFLYAKIEDLTSPYVFPDMDKIVQRIKFALERKQKIVIYGDYDCDGVGAIAILKLTLQEHSASVEHYIPQRSIEGYGVHKSAIKTINESFSPDLLITVDCGINAIEEIRYAKQLGIDVIVTDHHMPSDVLPDCLILNPFLAENASPLCGAGVVFMLVNALFGLKNAMKYIDICALSTVADIVPLVDDNRIIVKYGLDAIKRGHCRPGIKEILYTSKVDLKSIGTSDIGYKIAPRINAAGRLANANLSLRLLTEDDPTDLHMTANELSLINAERQDMNTKIFEEAMEQLRFYDLSKYKIIMLKGDWNEGIVGIVSAKLVEYFNLPAILVCRQEGTTTLKGSARSISGINLYTLFEKNSENLLSFGGHEMAAGISFDEKDFEKVLEQFNTYIQNNIAKEVFQKKTYYDAELSLNDINLSTISEINLMEPFGHKNPAPVFLDRNPKAKFKQIGQTRHLKAQYKTGELVAFDRLDCFDLVKNNTYEITYSFDKNYFNGKVFNQFILRDFLLKSYIFDQSDLTENFCKTFIIDYESTITSSVVFPPKKAHPRLIVTYSKQNLSQILKKFVGYNIEMFNQSGCNLTDTIVIAPSMQFPFEYYSKIIFCEKIGKGIIQRIDKFGKIVEEDQNRILFEKIGIEDLRQQYVDIQKYSVQNKRFSNAKKIFEEMYPFGISDLRRKNKFIIGFYILTELGLITLSKDGIIVVNNRKVELSDSTLYQYISE